MVYSLPASFLLPWIPQKQSQGHLVGGRGTSGAWMPRVWPPTTETPLKAAPPNLRPSHPSTYSFTLAAQMAIIVTPRAAS